MCGIAGVSEFKPGAHRRDAARLCADILERVSHRGPEGTHIESLGGTALGHCRLAFQDQAHGQQPVFSEDRDIALVFNGQIFNHLLLREELGGTYLTQSDAETILRLYEAEGREGLARLQGMYALALWDARKPALLLARDRLGKKPLFYSVEQGVLSFASEAKALDAVAQDRLPSAQAVAEFLFMGSASAGVSAGVHAVKPGQMIEWSGGGAGVKTFESPPIARSASDEDQSLRTLLRDAVTRRLHSDGVAYGVFTSGGLDSALIASLVKEISGKAPILFHAAVEDHRFSELNAVEQLADHLGSELITVNVDRQKCADIFHRLYPTLGAPVADPSLLAFLLLSEEARKHVKFVLTGDGADDIFGGYDLYLAKAYLERHGLDAALRAASQHSSIQTSLVADAEIRVALDRLSEVIGPLSISNARAPFSVNECPMMMHHAIRMSKDELVTHLISQFKNMSGLVQDVPDDDRCSVIVHYLQTRILTKLDLGSMRFGIEARSPFLDERVVDFALCQPMSALVRDGQTKRPVRELCRIYLPEALSGQAKRGFRMPIADLLKSELRDTADQLLSVEAIEAAGMFQADAVRSMWSDFLAGNDAHAHRIWTLLCAQISASSSHRMLRSAA